MRGVCWFNEQKLPGREQKRLENRLEIDQFVISIHVSNREVSQTHWVVKTIKFHPLKQSLIWRDSKWKGTRKKLIWFLYAALPQAKIHFRSHRKTAMMIMWMEIVVGKKSFFQPTAMLTESAVGWREKQNWYNCISDLNHDAINLSDPCTTHATVENHPWQDKHSELNSILFCETSKWFENSLCTWVRQRN